MALTPKQSEKLALRTLKTAKKWRRKGDVASEMNCVSGAVMDFLRVSLSRYANASDGIEYLRSQDVGSLLQRVATLNNDLYRSLTDSDGVPAAAVDNDINPVHVAWLVDEWGSANSFLTICTDDFVSKIYPVTGFWAEYYRAVKCLALRRPYDPVIPKVRGYQRYWIAYLNLIADLTQSRDPSATRTEIGELFAKRNRDKRLTDWKMIDGDGRHPVQWDFRETSILRYWELGPQRAS